MDNKELEKIVKTLKEAFPNGHPMFLEHTLDELDLHNRKNYDYAHGGDPLGNFNRVSSIFSNYPNLKMSQPIMVAIAYAMKQVDAVLWMLNGGYEGNVEGVDDRLRDIHTYFKIARILFEEQARNEKKD